jgi:hypothetical protein
MSLLRCVRFFRAPASHSPLLSTDLRRQIRFVLGDLADDPAQPGVARAALIAPDLDRGGDERRLANLHFLLHILEKSCLRQINIRR